MEIRLQIGNKQKAPGPAVAGPSLGKGGSTYGTVCTFFQRMCSVRVWGDIRARSRDSARGCNGEPMRKTLLLAGILVFAGTARAQIGGSINNLGTINSMGSLNGTAGINAGATGPTAMPSAPTAAADSLVNLNSKNPGQFVPSTFTSYGEAVELGNLEAKLKPMTLAEAARLAQEQKKNASKKPVRLVARNDDGKLVIAPAAKQ